MSKEQQQIIDEAFKNYLKTRDRFSNKDNVKEDVVINGMNGSSNRSYTQEEFINKIKTDNEFSEKWGLKIEERELSHDERFELYKKICGRDLQPHITGINFKQFHFDEYNVPKRTISLTYNDKKIESYE